MLGLTSLVALWIPQNSGPNLFLYHDIERFVAAELSIFVVASVVASCVLSRLVL